MGTLRNIGKYVKTIQTYCEIHTKYMNRMWNISENKWKCMHMKVLIDVYVFGMSWLVFWISGLVFWVSGLVYDVWDLSKKTRAGNSWILAVLRPPDLSPRPDWWPKRWMVRTPPMSIKLIIISLSAVPGKYFCTFALCTWPHIEPNGQTIHAGNARKHLGAHQYSMTNSD